MSDRLEDKFHLLNIEAELSVSILSGMYLTWPVGREGMKYLTPREGINFFPARRRRKGKKFFTFLRGEVFYTFPPNWSGKAFLHSSHTWLVLQIHTQPIGGVYFFSWKLYLAIGVLLFYLAK